MPKPKRHHYVPQFHLRRFCDAGGRLWVWDKESNRIFATSTGNVAAETQFYRLTQYEPFGGDALTMEAQLSDMEGEVSEIIAQWLDLLEDIDPIDKVPISDEHRWIVARFLAVQTLRTLDIRVLLSALVEKERGSAPDASEARELHTELMWNDDLLERFTSRAQSSYWTFAGNKTDTPFVTSDNPVSYRSSDNRRWLRPFVISPDAYLVYAISPKFVLYCYPPIDKFHRLKKFADALSPVVFSRSMVESENSGQAFMATRFVFSNRSDFDAERNFARTIGTDIYAPKH